MVNSSLLPVVIYPYEVRGGLYRDLVADQPDDRWVVEESGRYKSREPGLTLMVVSELQAKLALLRFMRQHLPEELRMTQLPRGVYLRTREFGGGEGVKFVIAPNWIDYEYFGGDICRGSIRIWRVREFAPFSKRWRTW